MKKDVVIITGMSGAGKSTALNILEDLDYYTIDNIPIGLENEILKSEIEKLAIGIDIRTFKKNKDFFYWIEKMNQDNISYKIIYLDAEDDIILGRYNLTRRLHPIKDISLLESIKKERELMELIKEKANFVINTSNLRAKDLEILICKYLNIENDDKKINVHLQSFGYRYGLPIDADLIFDVRFIKNPYYIKDLKEKTGLDKEVQDYIINDEETEVFYEKLLDFVEYLIPSYIKEGKKHLTIAIGCTGGQHRSVTFVEKLSEDIKKMNFSNIYIYHREKELGRW